MRGKKPLTGPLKVSVHASFKGDGGYDPHTKKPDIDNIVKMLDAFNGIVWVDDSQISLLVASKFYGAADYLEVMVRPITPLDVPVIAGHATQTVQA